MEKKQQFTIRKLLKYWMPECYKEWILERKGEPSDYYSLFWHQHYHQLTSFMLTDRWQRKMFLPRLFELITQIHAEGIVVKKGELRLDDFVVDRENRVLLWNLRDAFMADPERPQDVVNDWSSFYKLICGRSLCPCSMSKDLPLPVFSGKKGKLIVDTGEVRSLIHIDEVNRQKSVEILRETLSVVEINGEMKDFQNSHEVQIEPEDLVQFVEGSSITKVRVKQKECILCLDRVPEGVFVPCGHKACCMNCGPFLAACPICRSPKQMFIKVFE
jgi:hypothetical protein